MHTWDNPRPPAAVWIANVSNPKWHQKRLEMCWRFRGGCGAWVTLGDCQHFGPPGGAWYQDHSKPRFAIFRAGMMVVQSWWFRTRLRCRKRAKLHCKVVPSWEVPFAWCSSTQFNSWVSSTLTASMRAPWCGLCNTRSCSEVAFDLLKWILLASNNGSYTLQFHGSLFCLFFGHCQSCCGTWSTKHVVFMQ